jgi:GH25 family lysozyme M1 (1,4-beta-N-acetylmuramidase)
VPIFGQDLSHYDWDRGPVDLAAAVRDGISFMTHKVGEGKTVTDARFDDFWKRARSAKVPLLGAYYVNHPGDQTVQADRFLALLDAKAPGWRDGPFLLQVDAEKFSYMPREPSPAECEAFCDRLVQQTGGKFRPVLYAPKWLYGDRLTGVGYPLWASAYGTNPAVPYRQAYPGDNSSRWAAYSGKTPAILQYGSTTRIGTQSTCDANAFRGTLAQLRALVHPQQEDDVNEPQNNALSETWAVADALRDGTGAATAASRPAGPVWLVEQVKQMRAELAAIRTGLGDVDEQAVAAAVLAVLTPQAIAEAIPDEFAGQVADVLAARLAS